MPADLVPRFRALLSETEIGRLFLASRSRLSPSALSDCLRLSLYLLSACDLLAPCRQPRNSYATRVERAKSRATLLVQRDLEVLSPSDWQPVNHTSLWCALCAASVSYHKTLPARIDGSRPANWYVWAPYEGRQYRSHFRTRRDLARLYDTPILVSRCGTSVGRCYVVSSCHCLRSIAFHPNKYS